jgi:predicted RNase H-like HicB family nuclease
MLSQIQFSIECNRGPDGRWVAMVDDLPGFQLFGDSQEETLAAAKKVSAMLLHEDSN